ncbi:hypothetical protein ENUP19_0057G0082 [Entamoeba nuttalli]|uniref:PRA1 family protein n=2 Tax=Entamoeba nuttalli TaxID=412467 RepID=K2GBT4_ENTNP|nr:hypothetical protein ENU1_105400 [Entamoeba nuttalli P19]EKE40016.1 hypothetical protein ENU1_105400 [Entamoeba nuttalli P19]|eukprot:XP_008857648.1 hypothetical protein ENU1_105400 [Entamoeba nuttalli P19]
MVDWKNIQIKVVEQLKELAHAKYGLFENSDVLAIRTKRNLKRFCYAYLFIICCFAVVECLFIPFMILPILIAFIPYIVINTLRKWNFSLPEKVFGYPLDFVCVIVGLMASNLFCFISGTRYVVYNFITFTVSSVSVQAHIILCISDLELIIKEENKTKQNEEENKEENKEENEEENKTKQNEEENKTTPSSQIHSRTANVKEDEVSSSSDEVESKQ